MPRRKKKTSLYEINTKSRKLGVYVIASIAILLLNTSITVSTSLPILKNFYNSTLGKNKYWLDRFAILSPGFNITTYIDKLGNYKLINDRNGLKEYIFINEKFYLSAITDKNENVIVQIVTIKDKNFNPKISLPDGNSVVLGRTKFSEIPLYKKPEGCLGARRYYYFEKSYYGNPGNYQNYAFGFNQISGEVESLGNLGELNKLLCPPNNGNLVKIEDKLQQFREQTVIDTYAVSVPFQEIVSFNWGLGVDYDQIRTLPSK